MKKTMIILAATFVAGVAAAQTRPVQATKAIDAQQGIKTEKVDINNTVSGQTSATVDLQPATEAVINKTKAVKQKTKRAVSATTERVQNTTDAGIGKVKKIGSSAASTSAEVNGSAAVSTQVGDRISSHTSFEANKKVSAAGAINNASAGTGNLQSNTSGVLNGNAASIRSNTTKATNARGVKTKLGSTSTLKTQGIKTRPAPIKAAVNSSLGSSLGL